MLKGGLWKVLPSAVSLSTRNYMGSKCPFYTPLVFKSAEILRFLNLKQLAMIKKEKLSTRRLMPVFNTKALV